MASKQKRYEPSQNVYVSNEEPVDEDLYVNAAAEGYRGPCDESGESEDDDIYENADDPPPLPSKKQPAAGNPQRKQGAKYTAHTKQVGNHCI